MSNGFFGKVLWIDLTKEEFTVEILPEEIYRKYLGGYGLASKLIYDHMPKKTDPLSSESILGFFPGLLTGSIAPLTGRCMVAGKSPLTGTWGDASVGGYIGAEIKKCGFDGILIKGMAQNPKYVAIIDNTKEVLDASSLWGKDTSETEDKLKSTHNNVNIISIGPSGENLSLISGIVHDKHRVAARSGLGAVMGSKKLKAIVLKGNDKVNVANSESLLEHTKAYNSGVKNDQSGAMFLYHTLGLSCLNVSAGLSGDTPIKNWGGNGPQDFPVERLNKISAAEINKYKLRDYGCFSCSVQCGAIMKVPEANIEETHIPEYETCAAFGNMLLNDDLISLFKLNDICNRSGLDTISVGGMVAFAIECFENGLINKSDTNGLELNWGNSDAIFKLVENMIKREGFGDILADGPIIATKKIGKNSEKYAMHSLGQPLPMHDPKFFNSMGRTYAFEPTPGRHTASSLDHFITGVLPRNNFIKEFTLPKRYRKPGDDRYEAMKMCAGLHQSLNSLGMCLFTYWFQTYPFLESIKAVTGWDVNIDEIIKIGLRIQNLRQAFTLREGIDLANNTLPGRVVGDPPFEEGPNRGKTVDYKADFLGYCAKMGWNPENAYPLKETLKELELDFVIKDLY
ncbi:MAG: aldehyde ferredoxin oxidoreductase [Candidatus Lokiarchaeota archaeon]|nr:aldehyde ferredoxin oxidoreductase [Candidatus Lokiarchaeota archaeon]